jgi:hypothetical protein
MNDEEKLMQEIRLKWGPAINQATATSSVPPRFLAALIAGESRGVAGATRFESKVYQHFLDLLSGKADRYGIIRQVDVEKEQALEMERDETGLWVVKTDEYHEIHLDQLWSRDYTEALRKVSADTVLRQLSSSIGLVQIMGYHVLGQWVMGGRVVSQTPGAAAMVVEDLFQPPLNLGLAVRMLAGFAEQYRLDLQKDFPELLVCWNTGRPDGKTYDPKYASRGVDRMRLWG